MELLALLGYFIFRYSIPNLYEDTPIKSQEDKLDCLKYFNHINEGKEKVYMLSQISERTEAILFTLLRPLKR